MTVNSDVTVGTGSSNEKSHIILLMLGSGLIIFVQHAKEGTPQDGTQYIAIGIVGFILLVVAEFAPAFGFAFALLFFVAVLLNAPNGIPVIAESKKTSSTEAQGVAQVQADNAAGESYGMSPTGNYQDSSQGYAPSTSVNINPFTGQTLVP